MGKNLIIGIGNILMSDEGIGVHIIKELEKKKVIKNTSFLDMGTSSLDIGYYIDKDIEKLVIIDCIKSDDHKPGTVFKLTLDDLQERKKDCFSLHQLGLIDSLILNSIIDEFHQTLIIGIVPYDIKTYSTSLSDCIQEKFSTIVEKIQNVIIGFFSN